MEVCRICAEPTAGDSKISIFDGTDPIANMIHQLSGLEILDEYGLPDVACCTCVDRLESALELKQQCLKSDERFRQLIQQESILASVYEKNTEPDVPIISYKILYDQVIEHVPPDIETDYVVEVEASSLEQVSKSEQGKVSVEYINPQIETVYANVEEPLTIGNDCSSSIPPETETDYIVEVEVDESKNSRQRQKSTTSIKQEIATVEIETRDLLDYLFMYFSFFSVANSNQ